MPRYIVRKRKWPFTPPLKRPWELIRTSDGKPISFFATPEEAQEVAKDAEKGVDLGQKLLDTGLVKSIKPTGTMRGQSNNPYAAPSDPRIQGRDVRGQDE